MVMLTSKRLLLVAFLLLCIISITARARSLRETKDELAEGSAEKSHSNQFNPNQGGEEQDIGDLVTVDYTPPTKNPPIHN